MMKKMFIKLKSQAGETLAEVLIALLISTIGLMILAAMITSASSSISASRKALETYYSSDAVASSSKTISVILKDKDGEKIEGYKSENETINSKALGGKTVLSYKDATLIRDDTTEGGTP